MTLARPYVRCDAPTRPLPRVEVVEVTRPIWPTTDPDVWRPPDLALMSRVLERLRAL